MYDEYSNEREENEGWIAVGVLAFIILCGVLVLWEPDVETIGSRVHALLFSN